MTLLEELKRRIELKKQLIQIMKNENKALQQMIIDLEDEMKRQEACK